MCDEIDYMCVWFRGTGGRAGGQDLDIVAKSDLQLLILMPQPPKFWDCKCEPSFPVTTYTSGFKSSFEPIC